MEKMSIYELRIKLNLNIREFGESIGYAFASIKDVETGRNHISKNLFNAVKEKYNVELIYKPRTELIPTNEYIRKHTPGPKANNNQEKLTIKQELELKLKLFDEWANGIVQNDCIYTLISDMFDFGWPMYMVKEYCLSHFYLEDGQFEDECMYYKNSKLAKHPELVIMPVKYSKLKSKQKSNTKLKKAGKQIC